MRTCEVAYFYASFQVPSKNLKESAALKKLLSVKHFKLQVEAAPPKEKQGDEQMEEWISAIFV